MNSSLTWFIGPFGNTAAPDSARMNLAAAFVNGFVNCGFGVDKMMAESEDASKWFYKNKEYGKQQALFSVVSLAQIVAIRYALCCCITRPCLEVGY